MDMDGQADTTAPEPFDDLVNLIADTPDSGTGANDEGSTGGAELDANPGDDPGDDPGAATHQPEDEAGNGGADDDETPNGGQGEQLFEVTVKGEDGADVTRKVPLKELTAGYMRQQDYSRKTAELSSKEEQAIQTLRTREQHGREGLVREVAKVRALVTRLAALKSPEEMLALSTSNPQLYASERARHDAIQAVMAEVDGSLQQAESDFRRQQAEDDDRARSAAWGKLGAAGIDKAKLGKIFQDIHEHFGVPMEEFANVRNPTVVLIMQAAAEFRKLQAKAATLKSGKAGKGQDAPGGKGKPAPQLPPSRQQQPRLAAQRKALDAKFRSGKATARDLASIL